MESMGIIVNAMRKMKIRLFLTAACAFLLMGCATGSVQRFQDFRNAESSTLAVIDKEYGEASVKEELELAFRDNGFNIVKFIPLDSTLDYAVLYDVGSGSSAMGMGSLLNVVVVDYKSRKIVARMVYKGGFGLPQGISFELVDDMIASSVVPPEIDVDLK